MENPSYDTVLGYITEGHHIVQAKPTLNENAALTGLLVDMPSNRWLGLDALEAGYDRVKVNTTGGFEAYMYVAPQNVLENYSNYRSSSYEY